MFQKMRTEISIESRKITIDLRSKRKSFQDIAEIIHRTFVKQNYWNSLKNSGSSAVQIGNDNSIELKFMVDEIRFYLPFHKTYELSLKSENKDKVSGKMFF